MNTTTTSSAPDRRSFLRSLVTAGAGVAASAPLALTALPATAASPEEEDRELVTLGHRAAKLLEERYQGGVDLRSATAKFIETAPLPPRPRKKPEGRILFFKIVRNPAPLGSTGQIECSVDSVYDQLFEQTTVQGFREVRGIYNISDRYAGKLYEAAVESGYSAARARFHTLNNEIAELSEKAFELKPETVTGLAAQSVVLLVGLLAAGEREGPAQHLALNVLDVFAKQREGAQ